MISARAGASSVLFPSLLLPLPSPLPSAPGPLGAFLPN